MSNSVLNVVGRRIREIRKEKGLSQEQLGELAGFHFSYIGGVERAEKNISLLNIQKITNALDIPVHELFRYGDHIQIENNEKDILINQINDKITSLNTNDLRKIMRLLGEFFV